VKSILGSYNTPLASFIYKQSTHTSNLKESIIPIFVKHAWRSVDRCEFERELQALYPPRLVKIAIQSILQKFFS
jgi:hypothetical protein